MRLKVEGGQDGHLNRKAIDHIDVENRRHDSWVEQ